MRPQENEHNPYTAPAAPTVGKEPPRWRRWWKIVIVLGAVVVVAYLVVASLQGLYEQVFPGAALSGRSTSMELVNLELVDKEVGKTLKLRVPKAHLIDVKNWSGGAQRFITMTARFPTMLPETLGTPDAHVGGGTREDSVISIFLQGVHIDDGFLERYYQGERRMYDKPQAEAFGLEHYLREVCNPNSGECRIDGRELYAAASHGSARERVFFVCQRPELRPEGHCEGITRFEGFRVRYSFQRVLLHEWQSVHEAVLRLLATFVSG